MRSFSTSLFVGAALLVLLACEQPQFVWEQESNYVQFGFVLVPFEGASRLNRALYDQTLKPVDKTLSDGSENPGYASSIAGVVEASKVTETHAKNLADHFHARMKIARDTTEDILNELIDRRFSPIRRMLDSATIWEEEGAEALTFGSLDEFMQMKVGSFFLRARSELLDLDDITNLALNEDILIRLTLNPGAAQGIIQLHDQLTQAKAAVDSATEDTRYQAEQALLALRQSIQPDQRMQIAIAGNSPGLTKFEAPFREGTGIEGDPVEETNAHAAALDYVQKLFGYDRLTEKDLDPGLEFYRSFVMSFSNVVFFIVLDYGTLGASEFDAKNGDLARNICLNHYGSFELEVFQLPPKANPCGIPAQNESVGQDANPEATEQPAADESSDPDGDEAFSLDDLPAAEAPPAELPDLEMHIGEAVEPQVSEPPVAELPPADAVDPEAVAPAADEETPALDVPAEEMPEAEPAPPMDEPMMEDAAMMDAGVQAFNPPAEMRMGEVLTVEEILELGGMDRFAQEAIGNFSMGEYSRFENQFVEADLSNVFRRNNAVPELQPLLESLEYAELAEPIRTAQGYMVIYMVNPTVNPSN